MVLSRALSAASHLVHEVGVPTPLLLLDEGVLAASVERFKTHLPGVRLLYAVKANPSPSLLAYFHRQGVAIDVASAGEVKSALDIGIPREDLFLSAPIKTKETIAAIFKYQISVVTVDNCTELRRIIECRDRLSANYVPELFIRIRVASQNVEVDLNEKFGCSHEDALEIGRLAQQQGMTITGVSFHVGTRTTSAENYERGVAAALAVASDLKARFRHPIRVINIGGGFCDLEGAKSAGIPIEAFYAELGRATQPAFEQGYQVYAEPGRALVAAAGAVVSSVIGSNIRAGKRWIYLDDGIYGCYSLKLYESHNWQFHRLTIHPTQTASALVEVEKELAERAEELEDCTLAGPTCDSLDVVMASVPLPKDVTVGDIFVTTNMGAYTISSASNFNGFAVPSSYIVRSKVIEGQLRFFIDDLSSAADERVDGERVGREKVDEAV